MDYPVLSRSFRELPLVRSFTITNSETRCALMGGAHFGKFGSFSVAGTAKPRNLLGDSSGPLIRNQRIYEIVGGQSIYHRQYSDSGPSKSGRHRFPFPVPHVHRVRDQPADSTSLVMPQLEHSSCVGPCGMASEISSPAWSADFLGSAGDAEIDFIGGNDPLVTARPGRTSGKTMS